MSPLAETDIKVAPRVLIAEPIYSAMKPEIYMNRIQFWDRCFEHKQNRYYSFKPLVMGPRRAIRSARDLAIKTAIQTDATHLFMMDDDIEVDPEILRLLLVQDKDIIGGLCHRDDGAPIVFRDVDALVGSGVRVRGVHEHDFGEDPGEAPWFDHPKTDFTASFECAAVGAGAMLIRVEVLKSLRPTVPHWLFNYDDTDCSMDVNFCRHARGYGFRIWCLPDPLCVQVRHY